MTGERLTDLSQKIDEIVKTLESIHKSLGILIDAEVEYTETQVELIQEIKSKISGKPSFKN